MPELTEEDLVHIRIERGSSVPISRQIADQIRSLCLSGSLVAGTRMPSVRQLARELAVNQNTVLHVYEKLTAEQLLEMKQGDGTFVSEAVPTFRLARLKEKFLEELTRIVREGRMLKLSETELRALFETAWKQSAPDS